MRTLTAWVAGVTEAKEAAVTGGSGELAADELTAKCSAGDAACLNAVGGPSAAALLANLTLALSKRLPGIGWMGVGCTKILPLLLGHHDQSPRHLKSPEIYAWIQYLQVPQEQQLYLLRLGGRYFARRRTLGDIWAQEIQAHIDVLMLNLPGSRPTLQRFQCAELQDRFMHF